MLIDLTGRTALVTGSTAGIGHAIAAGLAAAGAETVVNGRTRERVDAAVRSVAERAGELAAGGVAPGVVRGVAADVGTAEGCDLAAEAAAGCDVLVNNTGIFEPTPYFEIPDAEWTRFFETNVMSGVRLTRSLVPGMVDRGWGRVIFVSSESALHVPAEMVHYGTTKTAQLAVARGLAESVPASGVTVNALLPGPTYSEALIATFREAVDAGEHGSVREAGEAFVAAHRASSIIGRPTEPEEVANAAVYLASAQASATTGAQVRVEGGIVRAIG